MTEDRSTSQVHNDSLAEAQNSLRLLARRPVPEDLTERIHARLQQSRSEHPAAGESVLRGIWSLWMPARRLQFAGAAVLALAVAGSMWSLHRTGGGASVAKAPAGAAIRPSAMPSPLPMNARSGSFGSAGAERVPPTRKPIKIAPPARKKPSAARVKPAAKAPASPTDASQDAVVPKR